MEFIYKGQRIGGPRGPAGPDGNPIGTVISFMGLSAPKDYLSCDGAEYEISKYPKLATFFKEQFGAVNHFGGDGETTFAVPDLRNLFLRGYHGEAEELLSGDVGEKQEGTAVPNIYGGPNGLSSIGTGNREAINQDNALKRTDDYQFQSYSNNIWQTLKSDHENPSQYTTRPVNMAVLFCIKAVESSPASSGGGAAVEIYSTEETRIGTWIDGKPLYRRVFTGRTGPVGQWTKIGDSLIPNIDKVVKLCGVISDNRNLEISVPYADGNTFSTILYGRPDSTTGVTGISIYTTDSQHQKCDALAIIEYTKTTDEAVNG